ncbi:MAG: hypothetical protein HDS77_08365 [Bacteroidales bacterium]|nr:hypothetical protein [Bacteroidales bacterium]MBD5211261.1 hypothetical protein [Bacteroidales bacterium]
MSILDTTAYFNGDMDKWIEKHRIFDETFKKGVLSVLLVDHDNQMPIEGYTSENPDLDLKYIDFAQCEEDDYIRIEKQVLNGGYKGYLFDNIDDVAWIEDKAELEYLVKMALKRDKLPFTDSIIDFDDDVMMVCRCKEIPEYLKGQSLQMIIIEV